MSDAMRLTVERFVEENRLLKDGDSVIVALSGGADSVCLLHILISIREKYHLELAAAHFHHGIRGAEADRDEAFVASLCDSLHIPLYRERASVPKEAARTGESVELCARRLRYRFLEDCAVKSGAVIATAHHRGDHAETVLLHLTRGTGITGLCGIPVRRGNIIRPLLSCSRDQIEAYCAEHALSYVTDSTNRSDDYARNRLRHHVMPVLRELNPGAEERIAATAALMREAEEHFQYISKEELKKAGNDYGYHCGALLRLEPIVLKYAVKTVLAEAGAPVDLRHIMLITDAMRSGGAVRLPGGFTADCAQGTLRVYAEPSGKTDFCIPVFEFFRTHGVRVSVENGRLLLSDDAAARLPDDGEKIHNLFLHHAMPCDIMTPDTVYRTRRAGDTFTDARRGVTKSLKKLMNELKIPREKRDSVPLIAAGSVVLWLSGCGVSAQAQPDPARDGEYMIINDTFSE